MQLCWPARGGCANLAALQPTDVAMDTALQQAQFEQAAALIAGANTLLVAAGAGMGVDSACLTFAVMTVPGALTLSRSGAQIRSCHR